MKNYGATRVHFSDIDGLNLCFVKRDFKVPLQVSQDSSQVTCEYCIKGQMGNAWREKYGIERKQKRKNKTNESRKKFWDEN